MTLKFGIERMGTQTRTSCSALVSMSAFEEFIPHQGLPPPSQSIEYFCFRSLFRAVSPHTFEALHRHLRFATTLWVSLERRVHWSSLVRAFSRNVTGHRPCHRTERTEGNLRLVLLSVSSLRWVIHPRFRTEPLQTK